MALKISLAIDSVGKALRDLGPEVRKDLITIIQEVLLESVEWAKELTERRDMVGAQNPHYRDSFEVRLTPTGGSLVNTAPYAEAQEFGAPPHRPPLQPLQEWAMAKFNLSPKEAKGVALAVREKITNEGLEPQGVFGDVLVEVDREIRRRVLQYKRKHAAGKSPAILRIKQTYGEKASRRSLKV